MEGMPTTAQEALVATGGVFAFLAALMVLHARDARSITTKADRTLAAYFMGAISLACLLAGLWWGVLA